MAATQLIEQIQLKLKRVTALLTTQQKLICTAESCTGGQLAMWLTELAGSSDWFDCGFVTYSNASKINQLDVSPDLLATQGAVSEPVALAMAEGALLQSQAHIAVAVTGIAGPSGGTPSKPVGTVCFAIASKDKSLSKTHYFDGKDRQTIRAQSCLYALTMAEQFIA